jgi:hypothetical protein
MELFEASIHHDDFANRGGIFSSSCPSAALRGSTSAALKFVSVPFVNLFFFQTVVLTQSLRNRGDNPTDLLACVDHALRIFQIRLCVAQHVHSLGKLIHEEIVITSQSFDGRLHFVKRWNARSVAESFRKRSEERRE